MANGYIGFIRSAFIFSIQIGLIFFIFRDEIDVVKILINVAKVGLFSIGSC